MKAKETVFFLKVEPMSLDELNNKLHSRDFHADRTRQSVLLDPDNTLKEEDVQMNQTETWQDPSGAKGVVAPTESIVPKKKYIKTLVIALGIITVIAVTLGIAMKVRSSLFHQEKIQLNLVGPSDSSSAELVTFTFEYNNDNWASLENTVVVFEYPDTFHPESAPGLVINTSRAEYPIGTIASRGKGTATLSGKFSSYRGDRIVIGAVFRYSPSSLSGAFEKRVQKEVRIASSPLSLEVSAPIESADGQAIEYEIRYVNNGSTDFSNLRVKLDYPDGFVFSDSDPRPVEENNFFLVGTLAPREEGKIVVRGTLSGERDQQKALHGSIGVPQGDGTFAVYSEHERRTRVVASPFSIIQKMNNAVRDVALEPGDRIAYEIVYKNEGNVGVRDAILTVELDSPYLDYTTLQFASVRGAYNQAKKIISWKASDFPSLARVEPGQGGTVTFSIGTYSNLRDRFPGTSQLLLRSVAKIDSPDIPVLTGSTKIVASSEVTAKFNTSVSASLTGLYQDVVFQNTGPQPMIVGQETTYTIHYALSNTFNTVANGRVSILLPTGIRHTGKRSPESERITFNERTNEFVWDVGDIAPGTTREIVLQVAVVPEPVSVGGDVTLVSRALFTGKDSFTGKDHRLENSYKVNGASFAP